MILTIDPKHNLAYLRFHEKTSQVKTLRVSEEMNVDISPDGTIYGIELLNANEQMLSEDHGKLVVINKSAGDRREMELR